ncbi:geraniol 8-hydroxylase-like [Trifolium pratense]|uniref:geraniol 8-hydroxylase-like n=1 Tax=Trifolium pratense TaxID=57577 RepID=UPI001E694711|nr:geraniol 8-hydroxylase-like [Trifolium pratense]
MDILNSMLFVLFTFIFLKSIHFLLSKHKPPLPPGPRGLPIIGNLHQLGPNPHKTLTNLSKTHGPIMSLKLGQITTIVMSSPETAKSVLQINDQFLANRKVPDGMKGANHHNYSLPFLPICQRWKDLRKTCNNLLFSNKNLDSNQALRSQKIIELYDDINDSANKFEAVNIGRLAFKTTINMLSNTVYSVDLIQSSDKAGEFKELVTNIMKEVGRPNVADCFPVLKVLDPIGIRGRVGEYFGKLLEIFGEMVDERLKMRELKGYCGKSDMLDAMLDDENNIGEKYEEKIARLSVDLFVAGTDTVTSTIEWAMAELLRNPKVMSKAKSELNQIIGKGNLVKESDITKLPYLQAIVKETFRLHPAVPLLLPRKAEHDLEINGYKVPKNAQVLVNVWAIGRDSNTWENPNEFLPERFLGSEIDFKGRNFELAPFGSGRRLCPGLPLAIRILFLMLGLFINCFDWELNDGIKAEDMNMDDKFGLTLEKAQALLAVPIKVT